MTLVVVGHSWTLLPGSATNDHLYDFLYAWHMPAFVLVTGYLSRSWSYSRERLWKLVRTVAVPYVLFETALALFRIYVGGERLEDLWRDPHWPMWYLSAVFFWRLATPVLRSLGEWALPVSVGVSILAGLYAGDTLDFARILGLLPFYVMGLLATPERFERLRTPWAPIAAVFSLVGIWLLTGPGFRWFSTEWLYYRSRYEEMDVSDGQAFLTRASLLILGTLGAWAFLALVPRGQGWFTRMGAATLVVYLFHGFFIKGASYAGFGGFADAHPVLGFLLTTLGSVGLALLLASPPVVRVLRHAVDPLGFGERQVKDALEVVDAEQRADDLAERIEEHIAEQVGERSSVGG
ncbi:acyltransferase family protein [Nocardioides sp. CBS4Y-1]|uniref:Acyltransferase family protein n=1 Tax=Nocardioides acrostichi TaxID=2784339 RepID=A0A930UXD0_9ACTN|nr:acyltransferase family protein [Nocardioides acrostichi]